MMMVQMPLKNKDDYSIYMKNYMRNYMKQIIRNPMKSKEEIQDKLIELLEVQDKSIQDITKIEIIKWVLNK